MESCWEWALKIAFLMVTSYAFHKLRGAIIAALLENVVYLHWVSYGKLLAVGAQNCFFNGN